MGGERRPQPHFRSTKGDLRADSKHKTLHPNPLPARPGRGDQAEDKDQDKAAGKMPHFGFSKDEAEAVVAALIEQAQLVKLDAPPKLKDSERDKDLKEGPTLIRSVGCLACHTHDTLGEATPFGGGSLTDIGQRRSADWLATWLAKPSHLNEHARMPVVSLSDKERAQIVLALLLPSPPSSGERVRVRGPDGDDASQPQSTEERTPHPHPLPSKARGEGTGEEKATEKQEDPAKVFQGRKLIESSRCSACHEFTRPQSLAARPRSLARNDLDWMKSCTQATSRQSGQPSFAQVDEKAVRAYVASWGPTVRRNEQDDNREPLPLNPQPSTINPTRLLEQKNCLACHDRDESKGLSRIAAMIAKADESLAGLHMTLIPPRLHAVGDRLHDMALAEAIQGGPKNPRLSWLRVRMPRFQHSPVEQAALLAYLIGHDRVPARVDDRGLRVKSQTKATNSNAPADPQPSTLHPQPAPDPQRLLAGRELLGGKGFSCVACHAVKDYTPKVTALGTRGSNLHLLGQRMRTDYYFRWTRAPLRIMPGVEMPNYQRPHEFILPGQLDLQLTAIWEALNDPNLTPPTNPAVVEQLLTVQPGERPRIVRDVFTVPGGKDGETVARAFAAGFGNGHSVLFDLDTGSVRAWTLGDFARQRCEGKRWYWDLAGTVLATRFDPQPDILFVHNTTGDVLTPETGWQFHRELTSYTHESLSYRLTITRDTTSYSASFYEGWSETRPDREEPSGWQRTIIVSDLKEAPLWPWFRGAIPALLQEAASIVAEADGQERPRGMPATARPFGGAGGGDAQLDPNSLGLTIRYTSSLKRVGVVSPNPLAPPLVSSADRITSVPGFRGQRLPLPRSIMPTAITFDDRQRPWFTSLKGHLYRIEPAAPGAEHLTLTTITNGLAAPFGVLWQPGVKNPLSPPSERPTVLVAHKPELLRLHVADDDAVTLYDVLATGWGVSDDYHDWACGIARDSRGNLFLGLGSDYTFKNRPKEKSRWRGDILRIDRDGKIESIARGLRYPTGLAMDDQDRLFVTDQQGVQNTFNELNYIQAGHRYGVPSRHETEPDAPADPPAVQIPHPWTRSVNGLVFVPKGAGGRGQAAEDRSQKSEASSPRSEVRQPQAVVVPSPPSSGERARVRGLNGDDAARPQSAEERTPHPNSLLKNGCREGQAPAEPRETSDFPHAHGSAGASPSLFQQAANPLPSRTRGEGTGSASLSLNPQRSTINPLGGHFLAAEYNNNSIIRLSVQDVEGVVQGAVYPFSRPTSDEAPLSATPNTGGKPVPQDSSSFIGPICIGISPVGDIYVGGFQDGGWAGGLNMGDIVKLTPEGDLPNGLREIRATSRGFDLEFFHPVDVELARQASQYKISGYTRVWKGDYATPDSGRHKGEVTDAQLDDAVRTVSLTMNGLKPGHVYEVSVGEIGRPDQRTLWPAIGHYTLHRIPE